MSGNKTQTQTTNSEPWKAAQPALKETISEAGKLYNSGVGGQSFQGSLVVPFANQTTQAFGQLEGNANAAQPAFNQQFGQVAQNAAQGGLNSLQQGAVNRLMPMANGNMLNGNPWIDNVINRSARDINDGVGLMASGAGRYGSGNHAGVLADSIGDMASNMRMQNYNTERGYMQDAIGSIYGAGQQQQQNINSNTGALSDAYGAMQAPSATLAGVGGNYEDLYGRQLNDQLRLFNDTQTKPWDQLARYNAIASGTGALGGNETQTAQGPSRLASGIGGALSGYDMFGNPLGAIGGGLVGLL